MKSNFAIIIENKTDDFDDENIIDGYPIALLEVDGTSENIISVVEYIGDELILTRCIDTIKIVLEHHTKEGVIDICYVSSSDFHSCRQLKDKAHQIRAIKYLGLCRIGFNSSKEYQDAKCEFLGEKN